MRKTSLVLRPEQIPLFLRAIAHNRTVIQEQIRTGRFCDADIYFVIEQDDDYVLLPPGRRDAELARSFNDYFAGTLVGALPFASRHGSDGIRVSRTGRITKVELKLCIKNQDRYTINENGFFTVVDSGKVVGFKSDCSACYEVKHNLAGKEVETYFVLYDGKAHELIAIWRMDGKKIVERLAKVAPKDSEKAKKISISLSAFMEEGEEVFLDFIPSVGVDSWIQRIYEREGRDPQEAIRGCWTKQLDERFKVMWTSGTSLSDMMVEFGKTKQAIQSRAKILRVYRPTKS